MEGAVIEGLGSEGIEHRLGGYDLTVSQEGE